MAGASFTVSVDDRPLRDMLKRLGDAGPQVAGGALYREGWRIMTQSKEDFVPVDLGALKSTGDVSLPETRGDRIEVVLGYGGPAKTRTRDGKDYVGYAIVVHEDLQAQHTVGGPKYLERPVLQAERGLGGRLAADMRGELERRARQ